MSIDPSQPRLKSKRFIVNEATTLLRLEDPKGYFIQSASRIVRECPPELPWASLFRGQIYRGLFVGPTSIAYLFLCLSAKHADLEIKGRRPAEWCKAYLELGQDSVALVFEGTCGITSEYLASNALKACLYQSETHAAKVLDAFSNLEADPAHCEWMNGRAAILPQQPWIWNGSQYLGVVHGEIGILTQVILSDPSHASKLESKLLSLINLQDVEGNWPFCHGAPGFVGSLIAIKSYFPTLRKQIDAAITRGRKITWEKGLLTKEPNFCYGSSGNSLALDAPQREHFLCFATPERIEQDSLVRLI
ncbi:uncharacterized protein K444DRAFT_647664 [Hyaloscypha bicolor E]|uniref:Lanthionine synthetase C-like protein n=1 Tax=Hyaloscypha bicolor E TaxID=1095630 RepID=A0A2J6SLM5_9HELO|nr:uncharacterized protein K444DRAFT_647664 [Hyaloscypha bicolor E]PMD51620.1 hypothetical protein K444DRAFT_647664 [Hyaloscypha bicolor E]